MFNFALLRYGISGFSAGVVHLGLLYVLVNTFGYHYIFASTVAVGVAIVVSFALQKFWTFKNENLESAPVQFFYYAIIATVDIILNGAFMYVLVEAFEMHYMVAQILVIGAIAAASFLFYSLIFTMRGAKERKTGKVLVATGLYPPETGGPATYVKIIEEELPKRNVPIEVFPFRSVRVFPRVVRHFIYFFEILQRATHADVVFALDPVSVGFPAFLAARMLKKKFFVKIVGDYAWEQLLQKQKLEISDSSFITPEEFQKRHFDLVTELRRKIEHLVAKKADKVIVPSEYLKKIVMLWGVPGEKIVVIHNAFEAPQSGESRDELRKALHLSGSVIVSAGRLVPWKGFDTLIDLMTEIQKQIPDVKLIVVGSGPQEEKLKAQSLKLKTPVLMAGNVSHDELLKYLQASDLFVLNTGYEGLSHLILEAMGIGVPIVTTNVGGNPELIENGKTGLLVSYNDRGALAAAILSVLKERGEAEKRSKNAEEYVRQFSKEHMLEATKRVLVSF
ncbi:MAG: glycosyltransferase [Parcubacteria group bacterium]|nr:glycosyltransferase [Parcubacteria group bacterium]